MASPQAENGHIDIANEIAEALCGVNLSAYESRVLWFLFRKTYGWHKKTDRISYTQFEGGTGIARRHIARTLERLAKRKIITTESHGVRKCMEYGFQKDYSRWVDIPNAHETVAKRGNSESRYLEGEQLLPGGVTELLPKGVNTKEGKETNKRKRCRSAPSSPEESNEVRQVFAALEERRGWSTSRHAAEAKAIRWMLAQGYTIGDILACHDHLKAQPFWKEKPLFMMSVQKEIGEWKKTRQKSQQEAEWKVR